MVVCIDTNVLLGMFGVRAPLLSLRHALSTGQIEWAISNEIVTEYLEVAQRKLGRNSAEGVMAFIELAERKFHAVKKVSPTFRFQLISGDPDDNKFADCAIAAEADWIITDDRHFDVLVNSGHKPQPISPVEFIQRYLSRN